jgi:hypothetical protein
MTSKAQHFTSTAESDGAASVTCERLNGASTEKNDLGFELWYENTGTVGGAEGGAMQSTSMKVGMSDGPSTIMRTAQ